jgi:DsbC/DsbD-like thiol-disulfide interchange protein
VATPVGCSVCMDVCVCENVSVSFTRGHENGLPDQQVTPNKKKKQSRKRMAVPIPKRTRRRAVASPPHRVQACGKSISLHS